MRLRAVDLVKSYQGRAVVNGVSLEVGQGEVVGLLGPNGAGKTTTFHLMVGLVKVERGQILLDEHDITRLPIHQRARLSIGYLSQEPSLFRKMTVEDNLRAVLELSDLSRSEREKRLNDLLAEFRIDHLRKQKAYRLSGGEARRLEVARVLSLQPKFLLLDEPFLGVDPITIADLQDILVQLKGRGIGILITDHNVYDTLRITDRAYILSEGKILAAGSAQEVAENPIAKKFYLGERFTYAVGGGAP